MHHKSWFIQDFPHGICKCENTLGIHKSADETNLNNVAFEEYENFFESDTLPDQQICRNYEVLDIKVCSKYCILTALIEAIFKLIKVQCKAVT